MNRQEVFDLFLDGMLDCAAEAFHSTDQYRLLQEKLERMERDCETNLTQDEQDFARKCFELLLDVSGQQEQYIYRQGMRDGVAVLKRLGVLA